jgi:hypothetical protein
MKNSPKSHAMEKQGSSLANLSMVRAAASVPRDGHHRWIAPPSPPSTAILD